VENERGYTFSVGKQAMK
jgi:hypothetical protein